MGVKPDWLYLEAGEWVNRVARSMRIIVGGAKSSNLYSFIGAWHELAIEAYMAGYVAGHKAGKKSSIGGVISGLKKRGV